MKKEKHETPIVDEKEQVLNEQTTERNISDEETTEDAANQIVDEIETMSKKCTELNDKNLRLMAEFDNYRKRTSKERVDLLKTAGESIFVDMLSLVDDFERGLKAMETSEDVQAVKDGVDLIYSKFTAFLSKHGVQSIPTENQIFDTEFHEAITTFPAPSEDLKGKIVDCVSKGYTLHNKVIRFSKVVVGE